MSEEMESDYEKTCPRCGVFELYNNPRSNQCPECDARDNEERDAWVRIYASASSHPDRPVSAQPDIWADVGLVEFQKRFPYPEKPK